MGGGAVQFSYYEGERITRAQLLALGISLADIDAMDEVERQDVLAIHSVDVVNRINMLRSK